MVRHHHVHALLFGVGNGRICRNAVVYGDDQAHALGGHQVHRRLGKAIAVVIPAGQLVINVRTGGIQIGIQQRGGCHAVHIVIPEYGDAFAVVDGAVDACHGRLHAGKEHRVRQSVPAAAHGARRFGCVQPTGAHHVAHKARHAQRRAERGGAGWVGADGLPGTVKHGMGLLLTKNHGFFRGLPRTGGSENYTAAAAGQTARLISAS